MLFIGITFLLCYGALMSYRIITHNGKAHMDELLASALLAIHLGEEPESIERIESHEAAELVRSSEIPEDSWLLDCGMELAPARNLFDHHQDRELDSAALLIFNEFFSELEGTDLHEYIKLVSKVDTGGPMSLDDFEHVNESRKYLGFSQQVVLKIFETDPVLILRLFKAGLEDKIQFEKDRALAAAWLREDGHIEIISLAGQKVIRYLCRPPSEMVSPLRSAIGEIIDENEVSATLSFDDKQEGVLTYYRTDFGHDMLDFSKSRPHDPLFNHQGGFLMKFRPADGDEWRELLKQAVIN